MGTSGILAATMKSRSELSHLHFARTILALVVGSQYWYWVQEIANLINSFKFENSNDTHWSLFMLRGNGSVYHSQTDMRLHRDERA
jgi:hypothetical protein